MEIPKKIIDDFEKYCKDKGISGSKKDELKEKLKNVIENSQYEPGEAIGILAAQSISEPATQMSLDAAEKVIIKQAGSISIAGIGDFTDSLMDTLGFENTNGSEVCPVPEHMEIYVPSLDQDEKIQWKRLVEVSRHRSPEKLLEISTSSGRKITATDNHSFVVRRSNSIVPVSGKELAEGERLPSLRFLPENCAQHLELASLVGEKTYRKQLPPKLELSNRLGWLFGIYLSEGNCTRNYVSISNTDENILAKIRKFSNEFQLSFNEYDNFRGFSRGHDIRINSTLLARLLEKACGTGSSMKKVPEFAYSAKEEFVCGLLRGYFDGDGSVSVQRRMIMAHSNSEELIDGIKLLLTRFGIFARKCRDKKGQHYMIIPYKYAPVFSEKIGSDIKGKAERLAELSFLARRFINEKSQDFTEMVAGFDNLFLETAKKLGYPTRYINNFTRRQKIGITTLRHYLHTFERISREKGIDIEKELAILRKMADSDVAWDEIIRIRQVKPSSEYVYDFSVHGLETFTTFDGIVTHNTMRSYTLATMVGGLTKIVQGLPRMIEIFDLRKTFNKSMTIYLKDKYNSKQQAEKIAEDIREKNLKDIIKSHSIDLLNMQLEFEFEKESDSSRMKDILTKFGDVSKREKKLTIKPKKIDLKSLRKLKDKILYLKVGGMEGIENIVVLKSRDEWIMKTTGSNLKSVLEDERIDDVRSTTDDISQVYDVLGIEAARNCILREAKQTLAEQGLDVDMRHLMLVADMMCADGRPRPIGRYGISGEKPSVLARANFEETKKHLSNAAYSGKTDKLVGLVENVMIGQLIPVGTGSVSLAVDIEKMKKLKEK